MKRVLASLILALVFIIPITASTNWGIVADKVEESTLFIEAYTADGITKEGSCTGFIINVEKKYVLTASHCDSPRILANGTQAYKIFKDERKDLLVIRVPQADGPSLKLSDNPPHRGEEVASLGYGFGLEDPMFRIAHISNVRMDIEGLSGPFTMIDAAFIGGQSGGPVVNAVGEVVMIVQMGNASLGFGLGSDIIEDKVGKYFDQK